MRSSESVMENPSEIHGEKPEDYVGQKVEGFEKVGEFPKTITLKNGATFERGFVDSKSGNIFYTRPSEDDSMREILLIDKQGIILKRIAPNQVDSRTMIMEQAKDDQAAKSKAREEKNGRTAA